MLALSTCWNSHRCLEGNELVLQAKQAGFEALEISHCTKSSLLPGLQKAVDAGAIRIASIHAPCPPTSDRELDQPEVTSVTSSDAAVRAKAIEEIKQTIEFASRMNCDRIVLHLGHVEMDSITPTLEQMASEGLAYSRPYIEQKLRLVTERLKLADVFFDRAKAALHELLPLAESKRVHLAIETRNSFEQLPSAPEMEFLLQEFSNTPWIGAWHDFGHVQRQANLGFLNHEQYLRAIAPRLLGAHIHDVGWPVNDHLVPFSASGVDFDKLVPLLPAGIPLVWEIRPNQRRAVLTQARIDWINRYSAR